MKFLFAFLCFFAVAISAFSQEKEQDTIKVEKLDEVLVRAVTC